MIADVVVATSRNLATPTPPMLRALVDRAVQNVVADGQLDECEITLRDLDITARSFTRSLESIYAARAEVTPPGAPRLRVLGTELKRA